jgi:hypothetical protein
MTTLLVTGVGVINLGARLRTFAGEASTHERIIILAGDDPTKQTTSFP